MRIAIIKKCIYCKKYYAVYRRINLLNFLAEAEDSVSIEWGVCPKCYRKIKFEKVKILVDKGGGSL